MEAQRWHYNPLETDPRVQLAKIDKDMQANARRLLEKLPEYSYPSMESLPHAKDKKSSKLKTALFNTFGKLRITSTKKCTFLFNHCISLTLLLFLPAEPFEQPHSSHRLTPSEMASKLQHVSRPNHGF